MGPFPSGLPSLANSTRSISVASSASGFELLTRFETGSVAGSRLEPLRQTGVLQVTSPPPLIGIKCVSLARAGGHNAPSNT
jgi:hypothetical protein